MLLQWVPVSLHTPQTVNGSPEQQEERMGERLNGSGAHPRHTPSTTSTRPAGRRSVYTHRTAEELVVREVEGLVSVERWSCNRGASCVVKYTMGRLRDWSL